MPGPLVLTAAQTTALQALLSPGTDPVANPLAAALGEGVEASDTSVLIPAITQWATLSPAQQQEALSGLCQGFAAMAVAFGLQPPTGPAPISATISYTKPDTTTGTLVFTDGVLTSSS